jgi:hypothetical protein
MNIKWLNANTIIDLREANLSSIRKRPKAYTLEQDLDYWWKCLHSEHSTLRFLSLVIHDEECPFTVASQVVRHTKEHCQPVLSSARPDWNKDAPRDYSQPRWIHLKFTPLGLIRMMEERLCTRAEVATTRWALTVLSALEKSDDPFLRVLAEFCSPICVKYHYCREGKNCHKEVR